MPSGETIHLVAVRRSDAFTPYIDYVLRLFAKNNGWGLRICAPEDAQNISMQAPGPRVLLIYQPYAQSTALLQRVKEQHGCAVIVERGTFFGQGFLTSPDLPVNPAQLLEACTKDGFRRQCEALPDKLLLVRFDLVAAAFWFLSRYEEYITSTPDRHGRFLCEHSIAPPQLYDQPAVNRWFEHLKKLVIEALLHLDAEESWISHRHTIALTHDVDVMRKYRGLRGIRRTLSTVMHADVAETRMASMVLAGIRRDPYDSYDELFSLKEKIGAPSTFFFMSGKSSGYGGDYRLEDTDVRQLLLRARMTDEIAVHLSYESYRSDASISSEAAMVGQAVGKPVAGGRQHYLRFAVPETWRAQAAAKLRYDSTMCFADRCGFRCGWSGCFRPFDIEQKLELPIIEIPLIVMDVTLAAYEKISPEHSLERLADLLEASVTPGGAFVFLWHNIMRDRKAFPGYWDTFEYFTFAAAGSARYVTLSRLCDEFENGTSM